MKRLRARAAAETLAPIGVVLGLCGCGSRAADRGQPPGGTAAVIGSLRTLQRALGDRDIPTICQLIIPGPSSGQLTPAQLSAGLNDPAKTHTQLAYATRSCETGLRRHPEHGTLSFYTMLLSRVATDGLAIHGPVAIIPASTSRGVVGLTFAYVEKEWRLVIPAEG